MNAKHISGDLKLATVLRLSEIFGWGEEEEPVGADTAAFCRNFDAKLSAGACVRVTRQLVEIAPGHERHTYVQDILPPRPAATLSENTKPKTK